MGIDAVIDPLRLPDELTRFWRRIDPVSVTVAPYPPPAPMSFCLDTWRSHVEEFPHMTPKVLFPFCYESHGFLFVELHDHFNLGGQVFQWAYAGSPFYRRFAAVSEYVDQLATFIQTTDLERNETEIGQVWHRADFDTQAWHDACAGRLAAAPAHPRYHAETAFDEDVRNWPEHWLRGQGLTSDDRTPKGASATVARLLSEAADGKPARGIVHARVIGLAGTSGGSRVTIDDGTETIDVWCPAGTSAYGPVKGRRFEFDLVITPGRDAHVDTRSEHNAVTRAALQGDLEAAQTAATTLHEKLFGGPPPAEAKAIRPLD